MKFRQLIKYIMGNSFSKNYAQNVMLKLVKNPFLKNIY